MSYLCYLCLLAYSGVKHILSNKTGVLKEAGTAYLSRALCSLVSCVPNATSVSGMSILDCPCGFVNVYFQESLKLDPL
jgi:hypothetical protein